MSQSSNVASLIKQSMADSQAAVATNFAAQRALSQQEFGAKQVAEDADFVTWLAARDTESARRIAEINDAGTGVQASKLAEIAGIFGSDNSTVEGTGTIMDAYRLFLANDSSADASLTAAYNAENQEIANYRAELGVDDVDAILALI